MEASPNGEQPAEAASTAPPRADVSLRRMRALDGIRGASALVVVAVHAMGSDGFPIWENLRVYLDLWGHVAVDLFFCMSGYLITGLLVKERDLTGSVRLRSFYARRAYRVLPAYYVYVLIVILLGLTGFVSIPWQQAVQAATFTREFFSGPPLAFGILWSLCVEELFYLVWPAVFRRFTPAQLVKGLVCLLAVGPLIRAVAWYTLLFTGSSSIDEVFRLPSGVLDVIVIGCLYALVQDNPRFKSQMLRLQNPVTLVAAASAVAIGFLARNTYGAPVDFVTVSARALLAFLVIHRYTTVDRTPVANMLQSRFLVTVGTYSLSIYLWHVLFVNRLQEGWIHVFPLALLPAALCAVASRKLVEEPFLRLRARRARRRLTGPAGTG